jgi:exonuclease III
MIITRPTHDFYHHKNRGFHIDYVFLPEAWAKRIERVEVGEHQEWAKVSDHAPW